jgi:hypothetical protein
MVLRKGTTFHSPSSPTSSELVDFRPPSLPRRSQTNLDDVIDAHRRRVALTLGDIDKTLNLHYQASPSPFRDDSLPIPRGVLDHTIDSMIMSKTSDAERRVLRPRPRRASGHHESDSGLGTSIATTQEKQADASTKGPRTTVKSSALTRSAAADSTSSTGLPTLSARATNHIYEHTLKPLLAERAFKAFHPLVLECPRKIQEKQIVCLRDVEKTLLLLAPVSELRDDKGARGVTYRALCLKERTTVAKLYLEFCMTTIRCVQATVRYLSDREQTRPRDLPYNGGYFVDLVDQIRQYAQQLADANKKAGETDMDVDPYGSYLPLPAPVQPANMLVRTDEIKLHGGMTVNGRHAELVRVKKNGKAISLATGLPVDIVEEEAKDVVRIKRSASEELEDEDDIMRSMARRKKNATPEELAPKKCSFPECNKEFKRPCDLTKHEKTHSRPWKCPVPTCKYHTFGWPTEKEMDRHHNDKHSAAPPMYECLFKPCPYKSKRESNCKQHMEKAHNWTYVRTKTNGKKGPSVSGGSVTHTTPQLVNLPTPQSDHSYGVATPPDDHAFGAVYSNLDFPSYAANDVQFNTFPQDLQLDYSPMDNATPSTDSAADRNSAYQDIGNDFTIDEDIYAATVQLPTPHHQNFYHKEFPQHFAPFTAAELAQPQPVPHISPIGQGDAMLYTPTSMAGVDEGFDETPDFSGMGSGADFVLFPAGAKQLYNDPLFTPEVPSMTAGFSQPSSQDLMNAIQEMDWSQGDFSQFLQHRAL